MTSREKQTKKNRTDKTGNGDIRWDSNVPDSCRVDDKLFFSLERCRIALDNIDEGYLEHDLKGTISYVNKKGCQMLGKRLDELIGTSFKNHSREDTVKIMEEVYSRVFREDVVVIKDDFNFTYRDGTYKRHSLTTGMIKDQQGKPVGFYSIVKDTTEEHSTEDRIRNSEERYRNILDSMEESYFEVDLKGNFLFFNDTVIRDLGFSEEELTGKNFRMLVDDSNRKKLYNAFNRVYSTGESIKGIEWEIFKKNGDTIPVEASIALSRDKYGEPSGFRGVVRDITERKKIDEELKESIEKYRSIIENMEESYFEEDLAGNYTFFNDGFVRDMGYSREELSGMNFRENLSPDNVQKAINIWTEIYKTGKPQHIENYEIIKKDGSVVMLEIFSALLRSRDGKPVGFWGMAKDMTNEIRSKRALEESERRYRLITESIHDVIWTMDLEFRLTYLSPSVFNVFGYTPEELLNVNLIEYLLPDAKKRVIEEISSIRKNEDGSYMKEGHQSRVYEIEMSRKDGSRILAEIMASFIYDESDNITGFLGVTRDITERRRAEEEKLKLESQLQQAQKMESVGRLAGGVAHDFNNMLSVILGYVELIKQQMPESDPLYEDLVEIEKASMRSRDITSQLLAFSRKQVISPRQININSQVENVQKTLSRLLGEEFELKFKPGRDLWIVKFDPSQFEQVLINLSINARDAMKGGGRLTIKTKNTLIDKAYSLENMGVVPGEYVLLELSDTGSGIEKEALPYIFEPFYTTKGVGEGTGLGLSTVYGIVKQNGGFINVYSEVSVGTVFKIYIPRDLEDFEEDLNYDEVVPGAESGNIILVEDDMMVKKMVSDMLESLGYTVIIPDNPSEALQIFRERMESINLVITDVIMPSMSGRELRESLIGIDPDINVIFMSGYTADVIIDHGVLDKGMYFLQKPFSLKDLSMMVREAIRS